MAVMSASDLREEDATRFIVVKIVLGPYLELVPWWDEIKLELRRRGAQLFPTPERRARRCCRQRRGEQPKQRDDGGDPDPRQPRPVSFT